MVEPELSEAENIKLMTALGVDEITAKFIYDLETGSQDGDAINEDGIDIYKDSEGLYIKK